MCLTVFAVGGLGFAEINTTIGNALVALCAIWVAAYSISIAPIGQSTSDNLYMGSSLTIRMDRAGRDLHPESASANSWSRRFDAVMRQCPICELATFDHDGNLEASSDWPRITQFL